MDRAPRARRASLQLVTIDRREARRGVGIFVSILGAALVLALYVGGYAWLRASGQLVHVAYGSIVSPTLPAWEVVYAPAIGVESKVRAAVDPSWNPPVALPTSMMDGS